MAAFYNLLKLLKAALNVEDKSKEEVNSELESFIGEIKDSEWMEIVFSSQKNSVGCLLYDVVESAEGIPEFVKEKIAKFSRLICRNNYRFLYIDIQIDRLLKNAGIPFCILKGAAAAADYPIPDLRKAGDVDILLIDPSTAERAVKEIEKLGFKKEDEQRSLHHISMCDHAGAEIEVHTMLAEPFDNARTNAYIDSLIVECGKNIVRKEVMGAELPCLSDAYHAYELLVHMLQHFLRAGFGVKLLCDWVCLWNRGLSEKDRKLYMKLISDTGIKHFSDIITRVCIKYLGLKRENVLWMKVFGDEKSRDEMEQETEMFVNELMAAEEFGMSKDRMVALRGDGMFDYVREFHHQMHLNFPKAGKIFIFWPVLWMITLFRFLRNNRKLRSVSGKELLANARERGRLVKKLKLFEI